MVFDAGAIGLLRQMLIERLGIGKAREVLTKFGYQNGFADYMQMKLAHDFDTEMELLASGPVIHMWEGICKATPTEIRMDRQSGEFYFTGVWENTYESEQYLCFNDIAAEPVCWSVAGYASGWATAFWGSPLLAIEPVCHAKGDPHCGWLIRPPGEFGPEAQPYIEALKGFWEGR